METRIKKSLGIINENILFFNENKSVAKFELGKDVEKRYMKCYKKFLAKTMEDIQSAVDKYHKDSNLYEKYETLNNLIHTSPELDTPASQFYDDTGVSINSLTIDYKREYLENLYKTEKSYDAAIDSLERKVSASKTEISNYVKKIEQQI